MKTVSNLIVFRVDASLVIGSGHVMRCLALANAFSLRGYDCIFICRKNVGHLNDKISASGFLVHELESLTLKSDFGVTSSQSEWQDYDEQLDAVQTREIISPLNTLLLVVDHYGLGADWERVLKSQSHKTLVIDDLADRRHDCHYLLDQTLGREFSDYRMLVPESCQVMLGTSYALLRDEFSALREASLERRKKPRLNNILITMGGSDVDNVTGLILDTLRVCNLSQHTKITVVLGSQSAHLSEIVLLAESLKFSVEVLIDATNMAELMLNADLAIGASGSTNWERCCLGLPTLLVVLAENQIPSSLSVSAAGAGRLVGKPQDIPIKLPIILDEVLNLGSLIKMSSKASKITDGRGVLKLISQLSL